MNVFCAGDDDQSIYGYRGAKVELMQRFRFDFPGSKVMKFGVSYRLPDDICKATQSFISTQSNRIPKPLVSGNIPVQVPVQLQSREKEKENYYVNEHGEGPYGQGTIETNVLKTTNSVSNDEYNEVNIVSKRASIEIRSMSEEEDEINWIVSYLQEKMTRMNKNNQNNQNNNRNQDPGSTRIIPNGNGNGNEIRNQQVQGPSDYSIVILTRYGGQLRLLEEGLKAHKVPFLSRNFGFWNQQVKLFFLFCIFYFLSCILFFLFCIFYFIFSLLYFLFSALCFIFSVLHFFFSVLTFY